MSIIKGNKNQIQLKTSGVRNPNGPSAEMDSVSIPSNESQNVGQLGSQLEQNTGKEKKQQNQNNNSKLKDYGRECDGKKVCNVCDVNSLFFPPEFYFDIFSLVYAIFSVHCHF
ncbi:hypothetical protein QL285_065880 [Trifolium repens]|jgi:hypothetical protein|nr:hypothetical protein QL285_065880 [Trifolium repens]